MSMLAERKRKTKWVINPTKKPLWTTDSNGIKFGKGLMEKMGWSAGKGLGANEQGIQEPLKVSYKNDTKGMGFKGNDDDWIEHQDEFNCFLKQLRNSDESFVMKASDAEKNEIKSLEEKSKWSKARVHYQKFTRGKDLSRYSENDLACILGTNKTKNEKSKIEDVVQADSKSDNNMEFNFGVTTINSGSIQDYFKKKWIFHKKTKYDEGDKTAQNFPNKTSNFLVHEDDNFTQVKGEKKPEKKKPKLSFEECVETTVTPLLDDLEKVEKKKNKKKRKRERELDFEEEIENKKIKKGFDLVNGVSKVANYLENSGKKGKNALVENNYDCNDVVSKVESVFEVNNIKEKELKDQKKKKDKEELKTKYPYCIENGNGVGSEKKGQVFEDKLKMKKKKKSKKEKYLGNNEEGKVLCNISDSTNQSNAEASGSCLVVKKKKKKKDNKEETVEKEEVENCFNKNSNFEDANETEISSKQKKEKVKIEKTESVANIIPSLAEVISEVESVRKKKKKKKDKADRSDVNENKTANGSISLSEVKLNRKKNKNKESEEVDNLTNSESDTNNSIEEKKNLKKKHFTSENEPVKNKMRKSKKNKSSEIEDIELTETAGALNINEKISEISNEREFSLEVESVKKKKKKKKNKEEKLVEKEEIDFVDNNIIEITNTSNKKKKKKKDKIKEISSDYIETEGSESHLKRNNCETEKASTQRVEQVKEKKMKNQEENNFMNSSSETKESEDKIEKKIKKADIANDKKLGFSSNKRFNYGYDTNSTNFSLTRLGYTNNNNNNNNNCNSQFFNNGLLNHQNNYVLSLFNFLYSYNYFNNLLNAENWKAESGNGIQNHKTEFLNDKKVDKFYPGLDRREKLLRLMHLSNFSEFKGSNLEKLVGYGFLKRKINNKSV